MSVFFHFLLLQIIAILSFTPLSPKNPLPAVAPLVFVLAVTAIKEVRVLALLCLAPLCSRRMAVRACVRASAPIYLRPRSIAASSHSVGNLYALLV